MDRLTSRFAAQSLNPESTNFNSFGGSPYESDPIRRDSSQFFGPGQPGPGGPGGPLGGGLFEHPVVPQQPSLPPAPPQTTRVMIMADKLRWVYKDPHGNVQGPFTGLEMHEWYRGGYFHPNLEVRREDDPAFEPLHSLVKRIGNQREPFLVPLPSKTQTQVIPPRSTTTLSGWNTTLFGESKEEVKPWTSVPATISAAALTGTTLTADQQNALERRKQEEQYLLVRQRELAATQPVVSTPVPPIIPPMVHHAPPPPAPVHAYIPSPPYGPYAPLHPLPMGITHHVHSPAPVQVQTLPPLDTLRTASTPTQQQAPPPAPPPSQPQPPREQSPLERYQQAIMGIMSPWGAGPMGPLSPGNMGMQQQSQTSQEFPSPQLDEAAQPVTQEKAESPRIEGIVEKVEITPESVEEVVPEPLSVEPTKLASPQLETPLPMEEEITADIVYEPIDAEPTVAITSTPTPQARIAPWATPQKKDDQRKSPLSLKQIQELEAQKAAEQARQIALQREIAAQKALAVSTQAAAAAAAMAQSQVGLPQGSTWGSVAAKGWTAKVSPIATASPGKKTMAEIQKEEEEERARLARGKEGGSVPVVRGYAGAASAGSQKVCLDFKKKFC